MSKIDVTEILNTPVAFALEMLDDATVYGFQIIVENHRIYVIEEDN